MSYYEQRDLDPNRNSSVPHVTVRELHGHRLLFLRDPRSGPPRPHGQPSSRGHARHPQQDGAAAARADSRRGRHDSGGGGDQGIGELSV